MVARVTSSSLKSLLVLMGVCALGCTGNSEPGSAGQGGTANAGGSSGAADGDAGGSANDSSAPDGASTSIAVTPVAAAVTHACAIRNGAAYCWGENQFGQLGNGTTANSSIPVQAQGLSSGVQAVAGAWDLSCALDTGSVYCWGDGQQGLVPFEIAGISPPVATVLAYAALDRGGVYDWDSTFVAAPSQVQGLQSGVDTLGSFYCCIKKGAAYCWGRNDYGQRGDGTTNGQVTPELVQVVGLTSGVTAIVSGWYHVCALMNGAVYCWGDNMYGQLGHQPLSIDDTVCLVPSPPGTPCALTPVQVQGLPTGVTAITAGTYHTCAIANGLAYCWGANGYGELGDGTTTTTYQPVQVKNLTNVTAISAGAYPDTDGYDETCAVADGDVYCWGSNAYGQLGDGTTTDSAIPVKVEFPIDSDGG